MVLSEEVRQTVEDMALVASKRRRRVVMMVELLQARAGMELVHQVLARVQLFVENCW